MNTFSRINNITGWIIFSLSAALYFFTMEPTVSLWDCGEFISAAYKLEVGHPPGAPLYLMIARIFSLIAPDKSYVAMCVNSLSALASSFTVLFLFWTITQLARRIFKEKEAKDMWYVLKIVGCGVVGAMSFCFSDSFWFSATEAEVYALSSLFTALVFWCVLKWEDDHGKYANRWLVLIAFLMGLSIGIHLLNLLAIPAIVMIYYFRNYSTEKKKTVLALFLSFVLLLGVLYLIIPGTVKLASFIELVFVNLMHLPVNSGLAFFVVFAVFSFIFLSWLAHRKGKTILNILFLGLAVMLIGYSSYAMIVIRANANPPINTGEPTNVFSLLSYLNRDQYGNRPLIYGQNFNAPLVRSNAVANSYVLDNGKYVKKSAESYSYDRNYFTLFPRMYSSNSNHIEVYKNWGSVQTVKKTKPDGSYEKVLNPTFADNFQFFISYQLGYMYLRYFLWNFAGKQNDMQGNGGIIKGNWISGFDFIDQWMIGPQRWLPDYLKNNPGRNRYFLLPLILGIGGMIYHFSRSRRYFLSVLLLFIFTGIAIVVYTNQTPLQPRERDYVYVGSFYAFCIWMGLGVLWIINLLSKKLQPAQAVVTGTAIAMVIPAFMFSQNFDDHNRNGRLIARDIARNYLNSCEPNAVLFTAGDNDTYPLWYLQEVEGIRTDVRVINLMLLNAAWYGNQQRKRTYSSAPLPLTLSTETYTERYWFQTLNNDHPVSVFDALKSIENNGNIPSQKLYLISYADSVVFTLPKSNLARNELLVLDLLSGSGWNRPINFTTPGYGTIGLDNYLRLDGFAYKLIPEKTPKQNSFYGKIETERLYVSLMNDSAWSEQKNNIGLMDDHVRNMLSIMRVRQNYARLAITLIEEGNKDKAVNVLDRVMDVFPPSKVPYDHYCINIAEAYLKSEAREKGLRIIHEYEKQLKQELFFYSKLPVWMKSWTAREKSQTIYYLEKLKNVKSSLSEIRN